MNRNFLMGARRAQSAEEMLHIYSMVLYMLGGVYNVTHSKVKDLEVEMRKYPSLYRYQMKKAIKQALGCCEQIEGVFKWYTDIDGLYQDWMDITDMLEEEVSPEIQKLYYAIDNAVMRTHKEPHGMITQLVCAYGMSVLLKMTMEELNTVVREEVGSDVKIMRSLQLSIVGLVGYLDEIYGRLLPKAVHDEVLGCRPVADGLRIVEKYFLDFSNAERISRRKAREYGFDADADVADGNAAVNNGKEWTDFTETMLYLHYGLIPDEELAAMMGRTVGAIRAKARAMGIDRTLDYEKRLGRRPPGKNCDGGDEAPSPAKQDETPECRHDGGHGGRRTGHLFCAKLLVGGDNFPAANGMPGGIPDGRGQNV